MPKRRTSSMSDQQVRDRIAAVPHWYHQIEIRPGIVTPGINDSTATLAHLQLPERCDGMRVLDIGVRDGFFSFELERRGAEVVAIDYMDPADTGFPVARELLGSKVEYVVDNVYNVSRERYGSFDVILFLGVIYHLRDPLLALDRLWDVCNDGALIALETQILDSALLLIDGSFTSLVDVDERLAELCIMQFHPGDSLHEDHSNYWSPNATCTRALLEAAGFEIVRQVLLGRRGVFVGRRVFRSTQVYHRRIEKTTIAEGADPYPATEAADDASAAIAGADPTSAELELASARRIQLALESELAQARLKIADLQRDAGRANNDRPWRGARLRRALSALRQRAR